MPGPYVSTKSSLVVVKSFTYRGSAREWSNRYHTNGPETITLAEFEILADAVVAAEKACYSDATTIVRVDWADATTATSTNPNGLVTHSKTFSLAGTVAVEAGTIRCPGDVAIVGRASTDARSAVTNHPIYLFKYFHDAFNKGNSAPDTPSTVQRGNIITYMGDWVTGFSDGTNTHHLCSPRGAVGSNGTALTTLRHRDFPT